MWRHGEIDGGPDHSREAESSTKNDVKVETVVEVRREGKLVRVRGESDGRGEQMWGEDKGWVGWDLGVTFLKRNQPGAAPLPNVNTEWKGGLTICHRIRER